MNKYSLLNESGEQCIGIPKDIKAVDYRRNTNAASDAPNKPTWESFFKSKNLASEDFMSERDLKLDWD